MRTGGSSIEVIFTGQDWWEVDRYAKHLHWKLAKILYSEYWESYTKIATIRNTWDWLVSLYHHKIQRCNKILRFDDFLKKPTFKPGINQSHAIGFEMNYIIDFDNLEKQTLQIVQELNIDINGVEFPHVEKTDHDHYSTYYNDEQIDIVRNRFREDIERFGFEFQRKDEKCQN